MFDAFICCALCAKAKSYRKRNCTELLSTKAVD